MKMVIGYSLIVFGIVAGFYMGIWWAFIGGIIGVISEVRAEELIAINVATSIAKIVFSSLIGWLSAIPFLATGRVLIDQ